MINYKKHQFKDRLELFYYFVQNEINNFPVKVFLHSKIYYCRAKLEEVFNRPFSLTEVQEYLDDKSWQWHTPSQTSDDSKGRDSMIASRQDSLNNNNTINNISNNNTNNSILNNTPKV